MIEHTPSAATGRTNRGPLSGLMPLAMWFALSLTGCVVNPVPTPGGAGTAGGNGATDAFSMGADGGAASDIFVADAGSAAADAAAASDTGGSFEDANGSDAGFGDAWLPADATNTDATDTDATGADATNTDATGADATHSDAISLEE